MVHMWWTLQVVLEAAYPALVVPLATLIERRVDGLLCATATLMLLAHAAELVPLPRFPAPPQVWPRAQQHVRGIALLDCSRRPPRIVELCVAAGPVRSRALLRFASGAS